jgi:hypothetical protein
VLVIVDLRLVEVALDHDGDFLSLQFHNVRSQWARYLGIQVFGSTTTKIGASI